MSDLSKTREKINKIDKKMAELFEERMNLSKKVASYKTVNHLPIEDFNREHEVLEKSSLYVKNGELKGYHKKFQENLMTLSKDYQKELLSKQTNDRRITVSSIVPYEVIIKRDAIFEVENYLNLNRKVLIITDENVPANYSKIVSVKCKEPYIHTIKSGEFHKNILNYEVIQQFLVENNFTRSDAIIAVGGGVVGDLAGFIASTYMRGIDFYNIPTTLLSMVDSSIGGKTAINYMNYKNIVGSFYDPKMVIIDPNVLKTLNERQIHSGLAESIKMALTFDKSLYELIKNSSNLDSDIEDIIYKSLLIKKRVVEEDRLESNLRRVLNFGHTIGHAIESMSGGKLLHGECVSLGMMYFVSSSVKDDLKATLQKYNLPTSISFDKEEIMKFISHDKKASNDSIKTIWVEEIGTYTIKELMFSEIEELLWVTH